MGPTIPLDVTDNRSLAAVGLNGDGKLDLAITSSSAGKLDVVLGNGDGTFRSSGQYAIVGGVVSDYPATADFNGDGIPDLFTANYYSSSVSVLLGNGDGTFRTPVDFGAGYGARGVAVGDFNGDGRLDVAAGNQFANSISVLLNPQSL